MTTEIATVHDDEINLLPPKKPVQHSAIATLHQHADAMNMAHEFATRIVVTDLVPARYKDKPEDATVAILYGAELGLGPLQSLQNVFPIYGSPAMYARTMKALLKSRGYKFRTVEKSNQAVEIHGWEPGRDPDTTVPDEMARWTIEDAEQARYTTNKKYETEPRAMLIAKATAEVCRNLAPDVLLGISYSVEDLELDPGFDRAQSASALPRSEPITVEELFDEPKSEPIAERQDAIADAAMSIARDAAADDETPADEPEAPPTAAMNKKMHALFRDAGLTDRQDRLIVTGAILGFLIDTSATLTKSEGKTLIDRLESWQQAGELDDQIREILNSATLAAENTTEETPEGN